VDRRLIRREPDFTQSGYNTARNGVRLPSCRPFIDHQDPNMKLSPQAVLFASLAGALTLAAPAHALDAACEPILKASEARTKQVRWHSVTVLRDDRKIEAIKVNGKFFSSRDGVWIKQPANLDDMEHKFVLAARAGGQVTLSECKVQGDESVDGIPTTVYSVHIQIEGAPAVDVLSYINKTDGLPYAQSSANSKTVFTYKNVQVPKLDAVVAKPAAVVPKQEPVVPQQESVVPEKK
jgi:hypothetical protein